MFRPGSRALLRAASASSRTRIVSQRIPRGTRLSSTVPPPPAQKSRSWTNKLVRLGLAAGVVYYYNTSSVFAEEPIFSLRPQPLEDSSASALETLSKKDKPTTSHNVAVAEADTNANSPEDLEEQASQEGAFNPETGEINWDCPCLGGMAHGPCGEEFKAAFSCFVYSSEEPKGIECIDKFKGMQECFRLHPDIYGSQLEDDEVDEQLQEHIAAADSGAHKPQSETTSDPAPLNPAEKRAEAKEIHEQVKNAHSQERSESNDLVPKAWHDTADKNADT